MMTEVQTVVVKPKGTGVVAGVMASVLAILGIFTLGIIFVPLAAITAFFGSLTALKNMNLGGIGINILAWALTIVGLFTSPYLIAALGIAASS